MIKILFLGASWGQISPIWHLQDSLDIEIFTVDNQPLNPGHVLAKKSFNISTENTESLRSLVKNQFIDYVLCFASDIGQKSQAIISKELGNFFNPIESIEILTNKYLFRDFLNQEAIQTTYFKKITESDLKDSTILASIKSNLPLVSKPILGSGSKGVRFIFEDKDLIKIKDSFAYSDSIILENYIDREGKQICGDGFFQNGKLVSFTAGDGLFYEKSQLQVPYAESFPSTHSNQIIDKVKTKIEKILKLSGFVRGNINFDVIIHNGEAYIIEVAPRPGGNFIPEVIKRHSGIDLIDAFIKNAIDKNYTFLQKEITNNFVSSFMIHSLEQGVLEEVLIDEQLDPYIIQKHFFYKPGEEVTIFKSGSDAIGNIQFLFPSQAIQSEIMKSINNLILIKLK